MSAPKLTKEEVERIRTFWSDAAVHTLTSLPVAMRTVPVLILRLLTTLDAVQRERDEAVKEGLRLTVELEQRTEERDALKAEIGDLHSQLAQRRVSVPFPYQRDAPPRKE